MSDENLVSLIITEEDIAKYKRLDVFLTDKLPYSRNFLKNLFLMDCITSSSDKKLELKKLPPIGTEIIVDIPPPIPSEAVPENIPLEILFEDEHIIIINKEAGIVTHPAPGNYTGTLVNALLYHCPDLKGIGNVKRPGIVHRLDKGTSGVMVMAKTQAAHEKLVLMFSKHELVRKYEALVIGNKLNNGGKLMSNIGRDQFNRLKMHSYAYTSSNGKHAVTYYKVINYYEKFSHVELTLETGRTHQIRVHMSNLLNHPILCDDLYGNPPQQRAILGPTFQEVLGNYPYPILHAKMLEFNHPITDEKLSYTTPLPKIFEQVLSKGIKK